MAPVTRGTRAKQIRRGKLLENFYRLVHLRELSEETVMVELHVNVDPKIIVDMFYFKNARFPSVHHPYLRAIHTKYKRAQDRLVEVFDRCERDCEALELAVCVCILRRENLTAKEEWRLRQRPAMMEAARRHHISISRRPVGDRVEYVDHV